MVIAVSTDMAMLEEDILIVKLLTRSATARDIGNTGSMAKSA